MRSFAEQESPASEAARHLVGATVIDWKCARRRLEGRNDRHQIAGRGAKTNLNTESYNRLEGCLALVAAPGYCPPAAKRSGFGRFHRPSHELASTQDQCGSYSAAHFGLLGNAADCEIGYAASNPVEGPLATKVEQKGFLGQQFGVCP